MKSKFIFIVISLFVLAVIGFAGFKYMSKNTNTIAVNKSNNNKPSSDLNQDSLTISPQITKDKVVVDTATLSKNGFLVVREMEGDKLSQVIEMSSRLNTGTHTNVTIPLGSADIGGKDLIVMIYEDYGNDGVFNDLDMPAINEDGFMTASYVKTGESLPPSITDDSAAMPVHNMPGMQGMVKVRYTDKGFVPEKVEVSAGSIVEFINESSTVMWVASMPHPAHTKLPTFDQFKTVKKGAIFRFVFEKKGTWEFHDHINPSRGGVVTVN